MAGTRLPESLHLLWKMGRIEAKLCCHQEYSGLEKKSGLKHTPVKTNLNCNIKLDLPILLNMRY